jgi:hypothetical protein
LKGKLLFLVLVIITIVAVYVYLRPVKPLLSMDRVYDAGEPGSTVLVNVTISNVPSLYTWGLNLTWDPYYVQLTQGTPPFPGGPPYEIREGEFFKSATSSTFIYFAELDLATGDMVIIDNFVTPGAYVAGSGVILTLNFTIVRVGTSAIEFNPPTPTLNQSAIGDKDNLDVDHDEMNGLVTNEGPPPVWASTNFQTMLIYGELGALGLASLIVYVYANPRPPKSARRRADFQPTIDVQDQE